MKEIIIAMLAVSVILNYLSLQAIIRLRKEKEDMRTNRPKEIQEFIIKGVHQARNIRVNMTQNPLTYEVTLSNFEIFEIPSWISEKMDK